MNIRKYAVELVGTFALAFIVLLSLSTSFVIPTPFLAGLTLALFVYSVGHISGTHINPAVTIGAFTLGKIKALDAVYYIVAQFIGAFLALLVAINMFGIPAPVLMASNSLVVVFAEMIGTFFFTFGIASVMYGNTSNQMSGFVIGGSLLLGIAMASTLGSNAVLNPAVAISIGSFNWSYLLGPIIGSILGMQFYKLVDKK